MTRDASWWEPALQTWSAGLGFKYCVRPTTTGRTIGAFWREDGDAFIQIDPYHRLQMTGNHLHDEVCHALAWTLKGIYQSTHRSWRDLAVEHVLEFGNLADEGFHEAWRRVHGAFPEPSFHVAKPAYFAWVHFEDRNVAHSVAKELQSTAEEISQALFPKSVVGWPGFVEQGTTLLLLCERPDDFDEWHGDVEAGVPDRCAPQAAIERSWLRATLQELVSMLAADALVSVRIAVGNRMTSDADFYEGLLSAVACWRSRWLTMQNQRVYIWGEHPWVALFHGVGSDLMQRFVSVAEQRAPERNLRLNPELMETLQGVITANLNVSEAARILYLHRNTLMHRIDRIHQQTGYDIRTFRDAFVLWLVQLLQPGQIKD